MSGYQCDKCGKLIGSGETHWDCPNDNKLNAYNEMPSAINTLQGLVDEQTRAILSGRNEIRRADDPIVRELVEEIRRSMKSWKITVPKKYSSDTLVPIYAIENLLSNFLARLEARKDGE